MRPHDPDWWVTACGNAGEWLTGMGTGQGRRGRLDPPFLTGPPGACGERGSGLTPTPKIPVFRVFLVIRVVGLVSGGYKWVIRS